MLYPIFIHERKTSEAIGFEFPDFPGCFGAADRWEDVNRMAQETLECHFAGEPVALPPPTDPSRLAGKTAYQSGVWLMVDIDTARLDDTPDKPTKREADFWPRLP